MGFGGYQWVYPIRPIYLNNLMCPYSFNLNIQMDSAKTYPNQVGNEWIHGY